MESPAHSVCPWRPTVQQNVRDLGYLVFRNYKRAAKLGELPDRSRRAAPSEHCNEEVIDYFGRCVEPAAQADVGSYGRGRPSPSWRTVMADRLPPGIP
jgi:hypothetical protein